MKYVVQVDGATWLICLGGGVRTKRPEGKLVDREAAAWRPDLTDARATIDMTMKIGRLDTGKRKNLGNTSEKRDLSRVGKYGGSS